MSKRRTYLVGVVGVLSTLSVMGGVTNAGASQKASNRASISYAPTLNVAVQSDSEQLLLRLSKQDNFPYKVDWSTFNGVPNMVSAFQAGAIDIGLGGQAPIITAQSAGVDLKILAVQQDTGNARQLVAIHGITSVAQLKGKTIATQVGTQTYAFIIAALARVGLKQSDVKIVNLSLPDSRAAFQSGSVDAAAMPTQNVLHFQHILKGVKVLTTEAGYKLTQSTIISTGNVLADAQKVADVSDFISRWTKAINWEAKHPEAWVQNYYVNEQGVSAPVGRVILGKLGPPRATPIGASEYSAQQKIADLLLASGGIPQRVVAANEYVTQFNKVVNKANQQSGGPILKFAKSL